MKISTTEMTLFFQKNWKNKINKNLCRSCPSRTKVLQHIVNRFCCAQFSLSLSLSLNTHTKLCVHCEINCHKSLISRFFSFNKFQRVLTYGFKMSYFWNFFGKQEITLESCNRSEIPESNLTRNPWLVCPRCVCVGPMGMLSLFLLLSFFVFVGPWQNHLWSNFWKFFYLIRTDFNV
jgi:hypothetical protein